MSEKSIVHPRPFLISTRLYWMTAANQLILVLVKFEKDNKFANVDEDKKNVPCKHDTLCQARVKNVLLLRPRWSKYISSSDQNHSETITLRVLYTHIDHIREYPPENTRISLEQSSCCWPRMYIRRVHTLVRNTGLLPQFG